jgi:hypothetical protein
VAGLDVFLFSGLALVANGRDFGSAEDFLRSISSDTSLSNNWG